MTTETSFEKAFQRLEKILEHLHGGQVSLEDSLKLYEEADGLIMQCHKKLEGAEKKIEMLIKNRSGACQIGNDQKPQSEML